MEAKKDLDRVTEPSLFFASEAVKDKGSGQVYPGSINKAAPELGRYTSRGKRPHLCAGLRVGDDGWPLLATWRESGC